MISHPIIFCWQVESNILDNVSKLNVKRYNPIPDEYYQSILRNIAIPPPRFIYWTGT